MITIKRLIPSGTCVFCNKEKEVVAAVMDQEPGELLLCWPDVKKIAQMKMRITGGGSQPALATPVDIPSE